MSKRLAVAVVAFACVSLALGAAVKIKVFDNVAEANPDADGMAILNYKQGQDNTVAQVILSDLRPNTQYVVVLREPGTWTFDGSAVIVEPHPLGGFFFPISAGAQGQISTNSKGHLTFHASTTPDSGDFSDSDVFIFRFSEWDAVFPPDPERPEAPNLRIPVHLIGCNPNSTCP